MRSQVARLRNVSRVGRKSVVGGDAAFMQRCPANTVLAAMCVMLLFGHRFAITGGIHMLRNCFAFSCDGVLHGTVSSNAARDGNKALQLRRYECLIENEYTGRHIEAVGTSSVGRCNKHHTNI